MTNITAKAGGSEAGRGRPLTPLGSPGPHGSGGSCILGRHLVAIGHMTSLTATPNAPPPPPPEAKVACKGS